MCASLKSSLITVACEAGGKYGSAARLNSVVTPSPRKYSVTRATGSFSPQTVTSFASARLMLAVKARLLRLRLPSVSLSGCTVDCTDESVTAPLSARYPARAMLAACPALVLQFAPGSGLKAPRGAFSEAVCTARDVDPG